MTIPSTGSSSDSEAIRKILEEHSKIPPTVRKKTPNKGVEPHSLASRMDFAPGIIEKFPPPTAPAKKE